MDRTVNYLHYSNMMRIPTYALYGEQESVHDWLHWETIHARSHLHDFRIGLHRHDQFFQFLHIAAGTARVTIDGRIFDLVPPAVLVVPALAVHGFDFSSDVEGIVVTLLERDVIAGAMSPPEAGAVPDAHGALGEALGRLIAEADRPGPGHDIAMGAHLSLFLVALHRMQHIPSGNGHNADRARQHAQAFRELVDQRFRQTRRITDYAEAIGVSPTHLNRICREVLGTSALMVIERRIVLEARRMLLFSSLSIKEIGAALGYDDPAYFTRFATRMLGMAPRTFRQQAGSSPDAPEAPTEQ